MGNATVVMKEFIDNLLDPTDNSTLKKAYWITTAHELGHAIGGLTHPAEFPDLHKGEENSNCLMGPMIRSYIQVPGIFPPVYTWIIESKNQEFCGKCVENLKNHSWE